MISDNMRFIAFNILCAFCVFCVKGDSISEFKTFVDETTKKIIDYEQQFFDSFIVLVSNLKDTSTEALGESWNATFVFSDVLNENAETKEKKDCIASELKKLTDIISSVPFTLGSCRENAEESFQPVRTKIQDAHKTLMEVEKDLDAVRSSCSKEGEKSEECVSFKLNELQGSMKTILDHMQGYMVEAGTVKPKILSDAMFCNAKVLKEVHESVTNIQKNLQKCV